MTGKVLFVAALAVLGLMAGGLNVSLSRTFLFCSRSLVDSKHSVSLCNISNASKTRAQGTFDELADAAYEMAVSSSSTSGASTLSPGRRQFNLTQYPKELRTTGGLQDSDRALLGRIYSSAQSAFEFGLGESTAIAGWAGVPRYSGVDSDAVWVSQARSKAPLHYQFHFGDIGPTKEWGFPNHNLGKQILRYVVAPLEIERDPFEVYLVDGRWRILCACMSFLHAMSRGADMDKVRVLIHDHNDRWRGYRAVEEVADRLEMAAKLAVFKLKESATEADLKAMYLEHVKDVKR